MSERLIAILIFIPAVFITTGLLTYRERKRNREALESIRKSNDLLDQIATQIQAQLKR